MPDRVHFDVAPGEVFTDTETRTIRGLAVPVGQVARKNGRVFRFLPGSVEFSEHTPLLHNHDVGRSVGRLVEHQWSERGLECTFRVSRTQRGDEMLALASDGVLGLSLGVDFPAGSLKRVSDEYHVHKAIAGEVSLTPLPAFSASRIDSVTLQSDQSDFEGAITVPDETVDAPAAATSVTVNVDSEMIANAIIGSMRVAGDGPTPQPVPTAVTQVREPVPYRFDGRPGRFSFVRDAYQGYGKHDPEARERIERFLADLSETFVTGANVAALTPNGYRPDLYVDERDPRRPLGNLVSGGTLADIVPFVVPKFASASNLVNPHVEGVEPTLATFTATDQTIEPHALSGKAALTRELVDKAGPQVDQMVWNKMNQAGATAAEARIAQMLADFTDASPLALNGADAALADDLETTFLGVNDVDRFGVLAAEPALFTALATARDSTGRKLFPAVNPQNADGTRAAYWTLDLGNGLTAVQVPTLDESYLIERGAIYQWLSAPRKLNFDIQVHSVFIGYWQYSAEAIIDDAGIRRVTYTA